MKKTILAFLTALLLVTGGTLVYYLYGYKDSFWIQAASYIPIVLGWLIFAFLLFFLHISIRGKDKAAASVLRKALHMLFFIIYPAWLVALVAGFVQLEYAMQDRVSRTLSTGDVRFTQCRVLRTEDRRLKTSTHTYAVIEYTAAGKIVHQAIKDDYHLYHTGQQLAIRYSQAHPDMFEIVVAP